MKGIGDVCSCTLSIERWSDQLIFQLLCSCNFGSRAQNDVWKLHEVQCFVLFLMAEFSDGRSALSLASKAGHSAVVRLLAEHLVRAGAFESECPSALVLASSHGRKEVVRELLGARADVESRSDGLHPLAAAAAGNHFATVSALLSANASINATSDSATPLLWAASSGCNRVLLLLIGARADVQCPDEDGGTPLIWAAAGGHDAAVAVLLQAGASLNVGDHSGRTALSWAASLDLSCAVQRV
eukprot:g558.t1